MENCLFQLDGVLRTPIRRHHGYKYICHAVREPYSLYVYIDIYVYMDVQKKIKRDSPFAYISNISICKAMCWLHCRSPKFKSSQLFESARYAPQILANVGKYSFLNGV